MNRCVKIRMSIRYRYIYTTNIMLILFIVNDRVGADICPYAYVTVKFLAFNYIKYMYCAELNNQKKVKFAQTICISEFDFQERLLYSKFYRF